MADGGFTEEGLEERRESGLSKGRGNQLSQGREEWSVGEVMEEKRGGA